MKTNSDSSPVKSSKLKPKNNDFQANNKINSSKNLIKGDGLGHSTKSGNHHKLLQQIKEAELNLLQDMPKPPVVLSLDDTPLFFLGDFSLTIGKAKSRKTFLNSLLMAVLVSNNGIENIKSNLPDDKLNVLFFDTEQGKYHAYKTAMRVNRMLGIQSAPNFKAFHLRRYSPKERLQIIEYVIFNTPNVGVVFIDGIRDLVTSINDEMQATKIASKLMKWSQELNIHISCTLHMNKGDNNARGHLGTELLNKSLVTISVTKCKNASEFSEVVVTESREKEPPPFMFGIDDEELPYVVTQSELSHIKLDMQKTGLGTATYSREYHLEKLDEIFSKTKELPYGKLVSVIKDEYSIGVNKAKKFVKYFRMEGFIAKTRKGTKSVYGIGMG
jgi:hypothetical protein